jgi:hypothetical protein
MMPAVSEKQKKFMDAAANNPAFAKQANIPVGVAKEFSEKSKGMKFGKGSNAARPDLQKVNKPKTLHGKMSVMKGGGMAKNGMKHEDVKMDKSMMQKAVNKHEGRLHKGATMTKLAKGGGIESKGKTKGAMVKMKMGGKAC